MDAIVFANRLFSPPCVDSSAWLGTCLDYERRGLCHDGVSHPSATNGSSQCCACGKDGLREPCLSSHDQEHRVPAAIVVAAAMQRRASRAHWLQDVCARPTVYGYSARRFESIAPKALQVTELVLWAAMVHRLLYLGLCGRVCDAALKVLPRTRQGEDIFASSAEAWQDDVQYAIQLARAACHRTQDVQQLIAHLGRVSLSLDMVDARSQAHLLNAYHSPDPRTLRGSFALYEDERMWHESQRWVVVSGLLESLGCGSRPCSAVEVGVYVGETSAHLLQRLPLLRLHGVDPYVGGPEQPTADESAFRVARETYARFGSRATLHRNFSREIAPIVGSADLVFIDGSHYYSAVWEDLAVWGSRARCVCGHDLNLFQADVTLADLEWAADRTVHLLPDSVWLVEVDRCFQF